MSNERSKDRSRERNNNRQRRSDHGSRRNNRRDSNQIDRELGLKYRWEKVGCLGTFFFIFLVVLVGC